MRQAAIDVVGADWNVEAIVDPGRPARRAGAEDRAERRPRRRRSSPGPAGGPTASHHAAGPGRRPPRPPGRQRRRQVASPAGPRGHPADPTGRRPSRARPTTWRSADAEVDPDDPDAETQGLAGAELLQRTLGAEVIEEIPHQ